MLPSRQHSNGPGLRGLALLTALVMAATYALVFLWAPNDADQGFVQKIFYVHVPLAVIALGGFLAGGVMGIAYLRTEKRHWDLRSYVAIHLSLILALGALATGSIWARASWGHWWEWREPTLVSFLIVFLLYACYQPLRFAIADPDRQARYAAVFSVVAGAFVPLNFLAVRLASPYVHPRVLGGTGNLPPRMQVCFILALAGMTLLWLTLWRYEIASKRAGLRLKALRRRLEEGAPGPGAATGRTTGGRSRGMPAGAGPGLPARAATASVPAELTPLAGRGEPGPR